MRRHFSPRMRAVLPLSFRPPYIPDYPCLVRPRLVVCRLARVSITCKGAGFSSFRECSHYGPPETLFAFGKRLIPATHPTMQYYIGPGSSDHASMVETLA
jgi:hypothetical protein